MTTRCKMVTQRGRRSRFLDVATPASGRSPFGGYTPGAGAALLVALAALVSCGDPEERRVVTPAAPPVERRAADPAEGMTTELDGIAPAFGDALLAELAGDEAAARAAFEKVLAAPDAPKSLAARAALHLAQLEDRAGRAGNARDLALRASALAPNDPVIYERGAQLRASGGVRDIRGPRLGTPLPGIDAALAEEFAVAERALEKVHKLRPRPIIEALSTSIRAKEDATEAVVAMYQRIADHGGLVAVAGRYRAGSLYHDLALGLLFELPPELDPNVAAGLKRTLRQRALIYLRKATVEYKLALDAPVVPESDVWRLAAETDLRAARDLLGEK